MLTLGERVGIIKTNTSRSREVSWNMTIDKEGNRDRSLFADELVKLRGRVGNGGEVDRRHECEEQFVNK